MTGQSIALDLTWDDLDGILAGLADQIRTDGVPDIVVGILRGGMIPAVMLAHRLGVRSVRAIEVTRTLSEAPNSVKSDSPVIVNAASLGDMTDADVVLVDDVAGSGDTAATAASLIAARTGRLRRAVLVVNTINWTNANTLDPQQVQDYIGCTCAGWVRFPWELG